MKNSYIYISLLLSLVFIFTACEKNEPDFFDGDYNGAYFNYNNSGEFKYELNFGERTNGMPDTVAIPIKIKLLGYLTEERRTVSIKTKTIEGYELPEITIPEIFFENKEYEKEFEVIVKRPAVEDSMQAVCLYLDGKGDIGSGVKGKDEYYIYVTEKYEKPELWEGMLESTFLGKWNKEKQIYLTNLSGDDNFITKLYSEISADYRIIDYDSASALNSRVFNDLRTDSAKLLKYNFPILQEIDKPKYKEPLFWNKYSELYQCNFSTERFLAINKHGVGLNTTNIEAFYKLEKEVSTDNEKKIQKRIQGSKKEFHKEDVRDMLEKYNLYASKGYPISVYKDSCWIKMLHTNVKQCYVSIAEPYWWSDPDNLGTAEVIKSYYGDYSEEKYQFILENILKKEDVEKFVVAKLFPFILNTETGKYEWDQSAGGEEYMKECYKIVKEIYDKYSRYGNYNFTIPERSDI